MGNQNSRSTRQQKIAFLRENPNLWEGIEFERRNATKSIQWRRLYEALVKAGLVSERTNHVDINIPRLIREARMHNGTI